MKQGRLAVTVTQNSADSTPLPTREPASLERRNAGPQAPFAPKARFRRQLSALLLSQGFAIA